MQRSRKNPRRGVVLIWMAITGFVLIIFLGLAIDTAWYHLTKQELQASADSAALAGAGDVSTSWQTAQLDAYNAAHGNKAANNAIVLAYTANTNDTAKDIVVGTWNTSTSTFTATTTSPNAVQVTAHGTANFFFGPIVGVSSAQTSKTATAYYAGTPGNAGIILLGTSGTDLSLSGNSKIEVVDSSGHATGSIWVDSSSSSAVTSGGSQSGIVTKDLYVVGNTNPSPLSSSTFSGTTHTGAAVLSDPLATLPAPANGTTQANSKLNISSSTTLNPGYYKAGVSITKGTITFNPGVYVIDSSAGLSISGGQTIINATSGVTIYLVAGPLSIMGGQINLSAPTSGTYANVALFQARSNSSAATFTGSASETLNGALYFPAAAVTVTGTSPLSNTGNQIIAKTLTVTGNSDFKITYNSATAFEPSTAGGLPYLVK